MIKHSLDHVRGVLDAVLDAAWDAADTLVGTDATPNTTAGITNASYNQTSAERVHTLHASSGAGAPLWAVVAAACLLALCLVPCCFRYLGLALSREPAPKPRAAAAGRPGSLGHGAASSVGSSRSSGARPGRAPAPAPGGARGLRAAGGRQLLRRLTSAGSEARYSLRGSSPPGRPPAAAGAGRPSARFVVPLDAIAELGDAGSFRILDAVGGATFSVVLSQDGLGGTPRLQLLTQAAAACASAELAEGAAGGGDPRLQLRGPGGLPLGSLAPREDGAMVLHRDGELQLIILGNDGNTGAPDLEVLEDGGRRVATISCTQDGPSGAEHVEFNMFDGADVQLVVCCVFAMLFLWREGH